MKAQVMAPKFKYAVQCYGADGALKWAEDIENLVTTVGKNDLADKYFAGSAYTASWFIGLIDNASYTAVAVGDTMATHGGWVEGVPYSDAARLAPTWGAASGGVKAATTFVEFSINATAVVKGAFMNSVSTKSGTTGILYSAAAFAANRSVVSGDKLRVTPTMTIA